MKKIRVALYGYGNLSRGVETSMQYNEDMELCADRHTVFQCSFYHIKMPIVERLCSKKNNSDHQIPSLSR